MLAYIDCFSGISGDMLLGALLDAGLDLEALRAGLASLPLAGYTLAAEKVTDHSISGTRALVKPNANVPQAHRHLAEIETLIDAAALPERARGRAKAIFRRLGEAEARIHNTSIDEVHFHEVGAVDSIVDIVGVALGFELLGVEEVYCSELPLTSGRVRSEHGPLPVPAPATLELLRDTGAVWRSVAAEGELVTPTGAAVAAALAHFERPTLAVRTIGYGFGQRSNLPWANCVRLVLGDAAGAARTRIEESERTPEAFERDEVVVLESNIDTMTGEALGWLMERLMEAGALDVSYSPLHMKKNRPGTLLMVIARTEDAERLGGLVLRESATLGVRMRRMERLKAERREEQIETPLGAARVKLKLVEGKVVDVAPEYDDCRALAVQHGLPLETVRARVTKAARAHFGVDDE
jgi:pyridinium-3,5-bisthiocarboxylic acid mononucleotide nickel chelatase